MGDGISRGVMTGSMVELHFDVIFDLLNEKKHCSIDNNHQLQGTLNMPLNSPADILRLATAVEARSTNETLRNETSSRSHCITTLTYIQRDIATDLVTTSRFNFVDLMGSERSKGANSAHDVTKK